MRNPESLKKSEEFERVYKKGKSYANKLLVMYVLPNGSDRNKLGISISKKVGNSVVRHHFARLVRESMRLSEEVLNKGFDIVVVARSEAKNADYHKIESAFRHLAGLHHLVPRERTGQ